MFGASNVSTRKIHHAKTKNIQKKTTTTKKKTKMNIFIKRNTFLLPQ